MSFIDPMLDAGVKFSVNRYPADGVTILWEINFAGGYIRREHVKAYSLTPDGISTTHTLVFEGPNTVRIEPAVLAGQELVIYRDTPKGQPLVDFSDGSIINEPNLDLLAQQAVFIAAETVDQFEDVLLQSGEASTLAIAASAQAVTALAAANSAVSDAAAALVLSQSIAGQFQALVETVQDLSGADLSQLARLNLPQTYTALQTFPVIRVADTLQETEFWPDGQFRRRPSGGVWVSATLNAWDSLTGKPSAFLPTAHTHPWTEVTGKPLAFNPVAHTHPWAEVTGKPLFFPPEAHTHPWSSITDRPSVAVNGQPADFSTLAVSGDRVVRITSSSSEPTGGADGDIHFVLPA